MADIPKGLGSLNDLLKRFGAARQRRELWRSLYQDAYDYAIPQKETFNFHAPGERKNRHVYDSTAVNGVEKFASRVMSSLTPPWMQWMDFQAGSDIPEDQRDAVNQQLEDFTKIFFNYLNHSDFSMQSNEADMDLAIGTGALMVEEGDESVGEPLLKFTSIPLSELYLEPSAGPRIETFWRKHYIEARSVARRWPDGDYGNQLTKLMENEPDAKVDIIDGILFNPQDGMFWQVVIYEAGKQVIFSQAFESNPGIVYRWSVIPGETYGRGPVIKVLPDILTANKVKEFILKNAALAVAGVYTGVDDGIFNPYTARIHPGTILPVSSNASTNPTLRPLERSGDFNVAGIVLEDLHANINKALFADPLGDVTDPVRSATENIIRQQEMLRNAGASFGRLKTEKLEPLVRRCVDILKKNGKLPDIRVDGREVTLRMASPLAKAEQQENFTNYQLWMSSLQALPPEIQAASVQLENIPTWTAEQLGLPTGELVRTEEEIAEIQKAVAQQAQAQIEGGGIE